MVTYAQVKRGDLLDDKLTWNRRSEVHLVGGASLQYGYDAFTGRYVSTRSSRRIGAPEDTISLTSAIKDDDGRHERERQDRLAGGNLHPVRVPAAPPATTGSRSRAARELCNRHMTRSTCIPVPIFIPAGDDDRRDSRRNAMSTSEQPGSTRSRSGRRSCTIARRRSATLTAGDYKRPEPDGRSAHG